MNIVLTSLPFLFSIYFYFVPKILINKYINKFIEINFTKYAKDHNDNQYIKKIIYKILDFNTFLGAFGGIIISVMSDSNFVWEPLFIYFGILFIFFSIYILIKYIINNLELSKKNAILELFFFIAAIILIVINYLIRGILRV